MDKAEVIVTAMIIKVMDNVMINTTMTIVIAMEVVANEIDVSMMTTATTTVRVDIVILVVLGTVITMTVAVDMVAIVGVTITTITDSTLTEITSLATRREQMGGAISRMPTVHDLMQHRPIIFQPLMNYCKLSFFYAFTAHSLCGPFEFEFCCLLLNIIYLVSLFAVINCHFLKSLAFLLK